MSARSSARNSAWPRFWRAPHPQAQAVLVLFLAHPQVRPHQLVVCNRWMTTLHEHSTPITAAIAEAEPMHERLFSRPPRRPGKLLETIDVAAARVVLGLSDKLPQREPLGVGEDDRPSRAGRGLAGSRAGRPRILERKPREKEETTTTTRASVEPRAPEE
jgi:hypothetical protein